MGVFSADVGDSYFLNQLRILVKQTKRTENTFVLLPVSAWTTVFVMHSSFVSFRNVLADAHSVRQEIVVNEADGYISYNHRRYHGLSHCQNLQLARIYG